MSLEFTSSEMMSVTAARALTSEMTCFVGIGLPMFCHYPSAMASCANQP